jgi:nitrous oxidase accessory protein
MGSKKLLVLVTILVFIGTAVLSSNGEQIENFPSRLFRGTTLYVGGSGPGNYTRIQAAIDNSSDGDTIFVYNDSSPYREHLLITKSVVITGENNDTTEIYGTGEGKPILSIQSKYTVISNFSIKYGSESNTGIYIKASSHITIVDCRFSNIPSMDAVTVGNSENSTIAQCLMSDSLGKEKSRVESRYISGITLESGCVNTTISGNTISNATYAGIIVLKGCRNTNIFNNTIFSNDIFGIAVQGSEFIVIKGNTIVDHPNVGVSIVNCNNTMISLNTCENNGFAAIGIEDTMNTVIECNNFIQNGMLGFFCFNYGKKFSNRYPNNIWEGNYWGRSRIFPKPILGGITFTIGTQAPTIFIPWFVFDWHPVKEPYDIGV